MVFSVLCSLCICARLFICALWSPAGKRADLLALVCGILLSVCHFPIGILCQVWCLIVSIPDLCTLTYFLTHLFRMEFPAPIKTKLSLPWIDATIKPFLRKDKSYTFVHISPRTLMSRFIISGSEHMYRRY